MTKILVAGMGNVLRGDDGFGIRVVQELIADSKFPSNVELYEAGIAGVAFVQELMNGYDALVMIDAVEKNVAPGTVFVLEPLEAQTDVENLVLHQSMVDMHYADPSKVLLLAKALNVCPPLVYLVGCQPEYVDDAVEHLRPAVARAVPVAVEQVLALVAGLLLAKDTNQMKIKTGKIV